MYLIHALVCSNENAGILAHKCGWRQVNNYLYQLDLAVKIVS